MISIYAYMILMYLKMHLYYFLNAAFQLMANHAALVFTKQYRQKYVSQLSNIQLFHTMIKLSKLHRIPSENISYTQADKQYLAYHTLPPTMLDECPTHHIQLIITPQ